jgi:serine O-acetyltransferase
LGHDVVVGAGAKVLGPLKIADGARIGSNSVVLKDVPPGATVVGIPGRIISTKRDEVTRKREEIANKIGFDAYGTTRDMPDPVANAINSMLDHIHLMDKRLEQAVHELKKLGCHVDDSCLPNIDPDKIDSIVSQEKIK